MRPSDDMLIMVVAQEPFETDNNQFCKLVPVLNLDGTRPNSEDFPNDGEIWWMVTATTAFLAVPGTIVFGQVEHATRYNESDPTSSRFQLLRESVRALDLKTGVELIDIRADEIGSLQDIVSGGFKIQRFHRPTNHVMIQWRSEVVGPFAISSDHNTANKLTSSYSLSPVDPNMQVFKMSFKQFQETAGGSFIELSTSVSTTSQRRSVCSQTTKVKHLILLKDGYERFLAQNPERIVLEPLDRKLTRIAKDCLTRKKRQELKHLLDELEINGRESQDREVLLEIINKFKGSIEKEDTALDELAKAFLISGILGEDRIAKAEQKYSEIYIQERTAALQAQIQENLSQKTIELRKLETEIRDVNRRLQEEEARIREQQKTEILLERQKAEALIMAERKSLDTQRKELERQQDLLQKNLQQVTKEFRDAGDEVVNRFLTIAPLLGLAGFMDAKADERITESRASSQIDAQPTRFEIPDFVIRTSSSSDKLVSEDAFFKRFVQVVENSGYVYRPLDLVRFHLSVKVGAITVLGGPAGTGKSSLPILYGRALLGDEVDNDRSPCLMVNVNPSWMEVRDLLGHMNTLEGRFYPAESGLFQHLVYAQEEHKERGSYTGIHLACLDEMNLSQVEHYFSDLMMALEREGEQRSIQCFSAEVAGLDCPFREWSRILLSPAVRMIGTVNFDETTRLLSDRFLDRINLIQLRSGVLPTVSSATNNLYAKAEGPMVTMADFESWQDYDVMPTELASLLDEIRPVLQQLGCPISPRVYRAICRFVGSSKSLISPAKAFDLQIAQRILPKIRSLVTKRQLDSLDMLLRLFKESSVSAFDETMLMLEEIREVSIGRGWTMEDY